MSLPTLNVGTLQRATEGISYSRDGVGGGWMRHGVDVPQIQCLTREISPGPIRRIWGSSSCHLYGVGSCSSLRRKQVELLHGICST